MGWPQDARHFEFGKGLWVPSDTMNEIQDRIVDLHREQVWTFLDGQCPVDVSGDPTWHLDGNVQNGWHCRVGGNDLVIQVPLREGTTGAVLKAVRAKVFSDVAASMQMDVYLATMNAGSPTTAPSLGASLGSDSASGYNAWDTLAVTGLSSTVAADKRVMVVFSSATDDDQVAAVAVTFEPLTPTP